MQTENVSLLYKKIVFYYFFSMPLKRLYDYSYQENINIKI